LQEEMKKEREMIEKNANIYDILKQEHKDVKKLFKQIIDEERFNDSVYMQIKNALQLHMSGEEKLLYPRLENSEETRQLTLESYEEHEVGKKVMNDIDNSSDNDTRLAKVKVLSEAIDMHVEEEESDLFKKARKVLSSEDEHAIARQFMNEKIQNTPSRISSI